MLDRTRRTSIGAHPSHRRQTMAATIPAPVETRAAAPKLKRTIGLWMATALVVGNMIGSGVFMLPATLAGAAGPISLPGWDLHRRGGDAPRAGFRQPRAHRR